MGTETKIEWADHTASPWYGCSHAVLPGGTEHPGCQNCYAEALAKRNPSTLGTWGQDGTRVVSKSFANNCRRWNREAEKAGVRQSVFPSLCDPFEDWLGPVLGSEGQPLYCCPHCSFTAIYNNVDGFREAGDEHWSCPKCGNDVTPILPPATLGTIRCNLFSIIDDCPWLDFMLLTKRPQNVRKMWPRCCPQPVVINGVRQITAVGYRKKVWLLASVSDQASADAMIPELLKCRDLVPVLGLSVEPLLGPIDFSDVSRRSDAVRQLGKKALDGIDWVIVGGESGPNARECDPRWIHSIVKQCHEVDVPCFVKQLGSHVVGHKLRDKKGGDWTEWPEDLRVREMPRLCTGKLT